jgi:hypothetical protein
VPDAIEFGRGMGPSTCVLTKAKRIRCLEGEKINDLGVAGAVQFEGGRDEGCARLEDGGVSCWGAGYGCDLGPRPDDKECTGANLPPRRVPGVSQAAWVSHRPQGTCVVRIDGKVLCWGQYQPFRAVDAPGATADPRVVPSLPPLSRIELLLNGAVAIDRSGALRVWRRSDSSRSATAFKLRGSEALGGMVDVAAAEDYAIVVTSKGQAWLLGAGPLDGKAGNHAHRTWQDPPLQLPGISDAIRASAATNHACVVTRAGRIQCLGSNFFGELGDGTLVPHFTEATTVVQFSPDKLPIPNTCKASDEQRTSCLKAGPFCDLEPSPLAGPTWCSGATPPPDWPPPPPKDTPCLCTCSAEYQTAQQEAFKQHQRCSMLP